MAITKLQSEALNLADDFAFTGTITGAGGINTPAFHARLSSDQSLTSNTLAKVQLDTEVIDTDNCYDNATNYRFTPNVAGKYYIFGSVRLEHSNGRNYAARTQISKNGSSFVASHWNYRDNVSYTSVPTVSAIIEMNGTTDYLELYAFMEWHSSGTLVADTYLNGTYFYGYKIIE